MIFALSILFTIVLETLTLPKREVPEWSLLTTGRDQCWAWALGEDWRSLKQSEVDDRWNERHGDLFILYGSDCINEGNQRMYKAWVAEGRP